MGSLRSFNPVKLFIGILASECQSIPIVEERLAARLGPIDHRSPIMPFDFTDYYRKETGDNIRRIFVAFERLMEAERLPEIKRWTNELEQEFASEVTAVKRPVNLDPGYIEHSKVVLASTKNFYHRMYLGGGIFGEVTMHYRRDSFQFFPWTYPDYQSAAYGEFFLQLREIYRGQLRTMCRLNREDT